MQTFIEIISWLASILSIIGIFLNARKNIKSWYFYITGAVLWITVYIINFNLQSLSLWFIFLFFNIYGLYIWKFKKN